MFKSFVLTVVVLMSTRLGFMPVLALQTLMVTPSTKSDSRPSQKDCMNWMNGLCFTPAMKSAWNPQANTRFPCSIF